MHKPTPIEKTAPTRRTFLKSAGIAAAGLSLGVGTRAQAAKVETLAVDGGPRAVRIRGRQAWRWPLYGDLEEKAMLQILRNPSYKPLDALQADWKKHFGEEFQPCVL